MNNILLKYSEIAKDYIKKANSLWGKVNFINVAEVLNNETVLSELTRIQRKTHLELSSKRSEFTKYLDSLSEEEYDLMYEEQSTVDDLFRLADHKFDVIDNIIYELNKLSEKSEEDEYLKKFEDVASINITEAIKHKHNMKTNKTLTESIRDKEPFEKIVFNTDFSTSDTSDRIFVIRTIKEFKGEGLKTDKQGVWHTFIPIDDVDKFMDKVAQFSPNPTGEMQDFTKFKVNRGLKDNQKITFLDYSISEKNPPTATGYLKPGFINPYKSLLKWEDENFTKKEDWIYNNDVDIDGFYHRDPKSTTVVGPKIEFGIDTNSLSDKERERLKAIVRAHGGRIDHLFGGDSYTSSGGKNYAIFNPYFDLDNFYQDAADFEPYYAEMEKGSMLSEEDVVMNEARKVVRNIFRKIFN